LAWFHWGYGFFPQPSRMISTMGRLASKGRAGTGQSFRPGFLRVGKSYEVLKRDSPRRERKTRRRGDAETRRQSR
jgi:hypothetical protein